jgi:Fe-S-cluster containining protein
MENLVNNLFKSEARQVIRMHLLPYGMKTGSKIRSARQLADRYDDASYGCGNDGDKAEAFEAISKLLYRIARVLETRPHTWVVVKTEQDAKDLVVETDSTCPKCEGSGEDWSGDFFRYCSRCGGSGTDVAVETIKPILCEERPQYEDGSYGEVSDSWYLIRNVRYEDIEDYIQELQHSAW